MDDLWLFTGDENPFVWDLEVDLFCWKHKIESEYRLCVGLTHLDGKALEWSYRWETSDFSWYSLKNALIEEFGSIKKLATGKSVAVEEDNNGAMGEPSMARSTQPTEIQEKLKEFEANTHDVNLNAEILWPNISVQCDSALFGQSVLEILEVQLDDTSYVPIADKLLKTQILSVGVSEQDHTSEHMVMDITANEHSKASKTTPLHDLPRFADIYVPHSLQKAIFLLHFSKPFGPTILKQLVEHFAAFRFTNADCFPLPYKDELVLSKGSLFGDFGFIISYQYPTYTLYGTLNIGIVQALTCTIEYLNGLNFSLCMDTVRKLEFLNKIFVKMKYLCFPKYATLAYITGFSFITLLYYVSLMGRILKTMSFWYVLHKMIIWSIILDGACKGGKVLLNFCGLGATIGQLLGDQLNQNAALHASVQSQTALEDIFSNALSKQAFTSMTPEHIPRYINIFKLPAFTGVYGLEEIFYGIHGYTFLILRILKVRSANTAHGVLFVLMHFLSYFNVQLGALEAWHHMTVHHPQVAKVFFLILIGTLRVQNALMKPVSWKVLSSLNLKEWTMPISCTHCLKSKLDIFTVDEADMHYTLSQFGYIQGPLMTFSAELSFLLIAN